KMNSKISNPIVLQRADPFVYKHSDGYYYFTGSYPLYDRIVLRRAKSLNDLQDAEEVAVWWKPDNGPLSKLIWAPEIHRANGKWYIYFAAASDTNINDNTFNHRMYVLESASENPLQGNWDLKGEIETGMDTFALDGTSFFHKDVQYYVWAQQDIKIKGHSNIYIAKMENPWTLATTPVMLSKPEYSWETEGFWVNEGPAVLTNNGKIFITYSGSATGIEYCMGMLTANEDDDLLSASSWVKSEEPVFQSSKENKQYGPGHNSFTESEDENYKIIVYHAGNYTDGVGGPLFDPNSHARAQKVEWSQDGTPLFGAPVADDRWTPTSTDVLK